jgi:hypothetical protein
MGDSVVPRYKQRTKIDWDQAFAAWAADPTLGYEGVARRFGVSGAAVRKHARAERWQERAEKLRARVVEREVERTIEEFHAEARRLGHELLAALRQDLLAGKERPKPSDFLGIVKAMQLVYGEATERVAVQEVRSLVAALVRVTAEHVPEERRPQVLAELEAIAASLGAGQGGSQ